MRTRVTVAAVSGALVLSALAVPAAQAVSGDEAGVDRPSAAERFEVSASDAVAQAPVISEVRINDGLPVVVGSQTARTFTVSLTASHPSGVVDAMVWLWHGTHAESDVDGILVPNEDAASCTAVSATTSTCTLTITARPGLHGDDSLNDLYANRLAGTWHVAAGAKAADDSVAWDDYFSTHKILRTSKLTVNASPEPIRKGRTLTVTGKLTRADWAGGTYVNLAGQYVKLQYKKAGATSWTTLKTIKSSSTGTLSTTTTATYDGSYRYSYAGATTTAPIVSREDVVDVQ
ncbi:DUF5707 domain-containing protein [Streptomyces sp. enrichment culture]|uniref:DUF5707 domain-containing protein n=1 Tax=Streptomyces sp. enrichment culture TaxID=1795815 RepID=UPI003F579CCB